jgi:two-component system, sensor histidine kinase YesM
VKRNSLRYKLFLDYSKVILSSFLAVTFIFLITEIPKLRENTIASLQQNGTNIALSIDREFDQMKMVGSNIAYSNLIKERFLDYISESSTTSTNSADLYSQLENTKVLGDLLTSIIGPDRPVDQINLFDSGGEVISSGLWSGTRSDDPQKQPWYNDLMQNNLSKTFLYTGSDPLISDNFTDPMAQNFITFAEKYYDKFNNLQGFIEIKENVRKALETAILYRSVYGENVYIFDGKGNIVYPSTPTNSEYIYDFAVKNNFPTEITQLQNKQYLICAPSKSSNFTTIMLISEQDLFSPLINYIGYVLITTLCTLGIALVMAYFIAQRITTPIGKIYDEVVHFDINKPHVKKDLNTNIIEITALYDSFSDMHEKLSDSINKQLLMQKQEMQSKMLALQSQMNPHFLYNSLAIMQAMAEDGYIKEIMALCQSMSHILRYISSDTDQEVMLKDELLYSEDYLSCMMIRYSGDLTYSVNIPDEMMEIKIPKLCIQLLVENSIKYSSTKRPPYHITIAGQIKNENYEISIKDNGPGFSKEALDMIGSKLNEINETGLLPSLEINGMGILNVYIRYKLLHGEDIIFRVENNMIHGACVTIGGKYESK